MGKKKLYILQTNLDSSKLSDYDLDGGVDQKGLSALGKQFKESTGQTLWPCMELSPKSQNVIFRDPINGGMQLPRNFKPADINHFYRMIQLSDYGYIQKTLPEGHNTLGALIDYQKNNGIYEPTFKGLSEFFNLERIEINLQEQNDKRIRR